MTTSDNEYVSWMFELHIKEGREDEFRALAAEMADATERDEPGTLDYEYYVSEDGRQLHLFERYANADAAMIHTNTFNERYMARFFGVLTPVRITLYGAVDERITRSMAGLAPQVLRRAAGFSR